MSSEMYVMKRDGQTEIVSFDKILRRIKRIGLEADIKINYTTLAMKVIDQLYDNISTTKIDELTADQCASMSSIHYDYATLASHITVSNHHKNTESDFATVMRQLYNYMDKHEKHSPLVSKELLDIVEANKERISSALDFKRDYVFDYFGFKTLEKSYLMRINNKVVERPQHMWMRVSLGIHGSNIDDAIKTYDLMSQKYFTHATPTLFNAGTPRPQLSSCFLIAMENDSIEGIYNTLKDCALISKWAGGIGLHIHNVRATNSHIRGTNGTSNGIVPMLRVFNNTAKYVDQCVVPETYIYTTQGPIEIQNCSYGETQVFNLTGGVETIENVLEHPYDGEIYSIETMHSIDNLRITPEHPVYALVGQARGLNYSVIQNRLDKNISKFEWIDAKDLKNDDMLVYKIPNYSVDNNAITADDCYMYGVILGDGCMSNSDQNGYISLHSTNKKHILDFAIKYFENKCIEYRIDTNENVTRIRWNKNINMPFRYSDVYDSNKTKRVHHKWLNLPIEKSKYILKGLIDTDGCNNIELTFDSTSRNLIESVRFICLKLGILTSGCIRDRVGESHISSAGSLIINKKIAYCLRIPKTQTICDLINIDYIETQFFKFFKYNDFLLTRIKNINIENYSGTLYDLQMKIDHDYMIHNCIVHNGGGKRNGSFAVYIEPWHADIDKFLEMRKNHGDEELKARDLFYALWIPDLFMNRVKSDGLWTLMCPDECPGLSDVYGEEFEALYTQYESAGKGRVTVKARDLWFKVLDAQMETGTPYLCYKDSANRKSNQKNIGIIKSSNLCVAPETLILTDKGHIKISLLENQKVNVWNGHEYSEVEVKKTGENQKLLEVKGKPNSRDDILSIQCSKYHKFYVIDEESNTKMVECQDLQIGTKLIGCKMPDSGSYDFVEIISIEPVEKLSDTFCFTEPKRHMGIFNGILTGQCSEIMEVSTPDETAVCNLASIGLPTFVENSVFNYDKLQEVASVITHNLNKVIDVNYYPTEKTRVSNLKHRPIGIGVQGLADVFMLLNIPFYSDEAKVVNQRIFETIYYGALSKSADLASTDGPYETYAGSPASQGQLQYDLWSISPSNHLDWSALKTKIATTGLRNSLLLAPMPTASTSQILGFNECFEPFTSNIYSRRTLAGEFVLTNKYLMKEMIDMGLWNTELKNNIIANNGSIQHIQNIPDPVKLKYRTVWEIPMRHVIDMAADRGAFICQSQSLNLWQEDPNYNSLTSMHFYAWSKGLKTGMYYLRRRGKHKAQQFTIEPKKAEECIACSA
jgi:ribonucleotide reductase alpha subunit